MFTLSQPSCFNSEMLLAAISPRLAYTIVTVTFSFNFCIFLLVHLYHTVTLTPAELIMAAKVARTETNCIQWQLWVLSYLVTEQDRGLGVNMGNWAGIWEVKGNVGLENVENPSI